LNPLEASFAFSAQLTNPSRGSVLQLGMIFVLPNWLFALEEPQELLAFYLTLGSVREKRTPATGAGDLVNLAHKIFG
jgi:hypothetical protein